MIKLFREAEMGGSVSGGYDSQPTDSGGPDPIPEDVRKKIEDATDNYAFRVPYDGSNNFYDDAALKHFPKGAEFGYSLSLPTIQAQEERIRVLEEAVKKVFVYIDADDGKEPGNLVFEIMNIVMESMAKNKALTPKTNNL